MKLYSNPTRAQAQTFYSNELPTPASAYRLQQHLLCAYREIQHWYDPYTLLELIYLPGSGGRSLCDPTTGTPLRAASTKLDYEDWSRKQVRQAREKLAELVPEIVFLLSPDELQEAYDTLLQRGIQPFVWYIFGKERGLQYCIKDGNADKRLKDEGHAKACGLGKSKAPAKLKKLPRSVVVPEPIRPVPQPVLRVNRSRRRYNPHNAAQLWIWPPVEVSAAAGVAGAL